MGNSHILRNFTILKQNRYEHKQYIWLTKDGWESQMGVNYFEHFTLQGLHVSPKEEKISLTICWRRLIKR
jgi:hypothetical protein